MRAFSWFSKINYILKILASSFEECDIHSSQCRVATRYTSTTLFLLWLNLIHLILFGNPPVSHIEEALHILRQIDFLKEKVNALLGDNTASAKGAPRKGKGKKGKMSPEARAKIAAAQKARWAAKKSPVAKAKPAAVKGSKRKNGMTPEAKAKIAAAMKARWAVKKKTSSPQSKPTPAQSPKKKSGLTSEGRAKLAAAMKARWAVKKKAGA